MNNLTRTQQDAKQAYLNQQQDAMLALYNDADTTERKVIIKNIDSFLSVISKDEKIFWLRFRRKLEILNEKSSALFPLGKVYLTVGVQEALEKANQLPNEFLELHEKGDWGELCQDDKKENELSVKQGFRILSAYRTAKGEKLWCITEADRNSTTILLPSEY